MTVRGTVACYCRVSTPDQSLQRQVEATREYAVAELGAETSKLELYRDASTGTDTARDGYKRLIADVKAGKVDAVVVNSISRISRSIRDLDRTVERIVEEGNAALHILEEGLTLTGDDDPYQRAMLRLLGVFAELEADMIRQRTREGIAARQNDAEYHHGPAPLGFEKDDGRLIEADNFQRVCAVLELVAKGELSKRKAAKELDTSRKSISRALGRDGLYAV